MKKLKLMMVALMLLGTYAGAQAHCENVKSGRSEGIKVFPEAKPNS
jgi:hypothetical protein